MKIGFSGAQSVGKTTLIRHLQNDLKFKDYEICIEVTRRVLSYGIPNLSINEGGNGLTQRIMTLEVLANTVLYKNSLMDRTLLDVYVYTLSLYENGQVSDQALDFVQKTFKEFYKAYDVIFYIKPEFAIVNDGVRSIDVAWRDRIANLFEKVIVDNNIEVTNITGSVEDRIGQIYERLN